jgi:hypothetical protein
MIDHCSILEESEVSVVINDMDRSYGIFLVPLPNSHNLLSTHIITIVVQPRALLIKIFITAIRLVVI